MIFDLSYIINYDWWDYMKRVSLKPLEVSDAGEVYELCGGTFGKNIILRKNVFWKAYLKILIFPQRKAKNCR